MRLLLLRGVLLAGFVAAAPPATTTNTTKKAPSIPAVNVSSSVSTPSSSSSSSATIAALSPTAAKVLQGLDLEGRVGQMLHLSVKKVREVLACQYVAASSTHPPTRPLPPSLAQVLFNYPDDPYVDKEKVKEWLSTVKVGTITNTPFDGQRVRREGGREGGVRNGGGFSKRINDMEEETMDWQKSIRVLAPLPYTFLPPSFLSPPGWTQPNNHRLERHRVAHDPRAIQEVAAEFKQPHSLTLPPSLPPSLSLSLIKGGSNQTITGWNVTEWRTALRAIQEVAAELKQPPILYGIDHLHGANYVMGATLFPQQINLAASFDLVHARNMAKVRTPAFPPSLPPINALLRLSFISPTHPLFSLSSSLPPSLPPSLPR